MINIPINNARKITDLQKIARAEKDDLLIVHDGAGTKSINVDGLRASHTHSRYVAAAINQTQFIPSSSGTTPVDIGLAGIEDSYPSDNNPTIANNNKFILPTGYNFVIIDYEVILTEVSPATTSIALSLIPYNTQDLEVAVRGNQIVRLTDTRTNDIVCPIDGVWVGSLYNISAFGLRISMKNASKGAKIADYGANIMGIRCALFR